MKRLALCLLVALLLLAAPVAAEEVWEKQLGEKITAVATDERGDLIFIGTESGMVYCYDAAGSVVWSVQLAAWMADPSILDIRADTEGHIWVRCGNDFYLRNAETGASIWSYGGFPEFAEGGDLSNTGIALNVLSGVLFDLKTPSTGHTIYRGLGPYNNGVISGDGTWVVVTKQADPNLYLYSVNVPSDDWIAPYGGYGWENRVSHTIAGSPDSALTDYPVEITVIRGTGTSSGSTLYAPDCRADFADIRFTAADGVTQLPYYLKSVNGNTATFFVQIPAIPASPGTTTIYVYWANPSAATTTSDLDAVDLLYDDFEDGTINTALWTTYTEANGAVTEANGYLRLYSSGTAPSTARITSTKTFSGQQYYITANVSIYDVYGYDRIKFPALTTPGGELSVVTNYPHPPHLFWNEHLYDLKATTATPQALEMWWNPATSARIKYGSNWDETRAHATLPVATSLPIRFETGSATSAFPGGEIRIYEIAVLPYTPNPPTHGAWGPVESVVLPLGTKTLDGTITDIDAPETGDWVAVSTTTKTYIIQVTDSGFGTTYSADRVGTPYDLAVADGGSFVIEGRNILADIFRIDGVRVGTYTTGGAVQHVAIAQKNGLYTAAGSDDGKYYVFSKDAASSWYLLHASDSYDPVTAIAMSWRGEIAVIGRADGRLTAFQVSEQDATGAIRVTIYKDNIPYATAPLRIEDGGTDQSWGAPITLTTDDYGIVSIPVSWGNYIRITVGDDELTRVLVATPSQTEYVLRITGPDPLRTGAQYSSGYDPDTQRIYLHYDDTREKTHRVVYTIVRAADNAVVFEREYTDADLPLTDYYQIPAGWTNTSYRIHLTASGSPSFTNTWSQWVGVDGVAKLPGELDTFTKMGICFFLLLFVAGLFSYLTGPQGAVVVSMLAGALVLWGWLPLPPTVVALCIVWAFLGLLGRTSGE